MNALDIPRIGTIAGGALYPALTVVDLLKTLLAERMGTLKDKRGVLSLIKLEQADGSAQLFLVHF
jgi:hypothetical protein